MDHEWIRILVWKILHPQDHRCWRYAVRAVASALTACLEHKSFGAGTSIAYVDRPPHSQAECTAVVSFMARHTALLHLKPAGSVASASHKAQHCCTCIFLAAHAQGHHTGSMRSSPDWQIGISPPPKLSCHTASPFLTPLLCSMFARIYLQGNGGSSSCQSSPIKELSLHLQAPSLRHRCAVHNMAVGREMCC